MRKSSIFIIPDVTGQETLDSQSISFDAVAAFSPSKSRSISNSPLSDGSFISEFLSDKGGRVVMEAYAADNPVILSPNNLIDKPTKEGRSQAAYYALDKLYKDEHTVTIVHKFDTLFSYFLTSFEPIIMPSDTIGFRLEFQEVRFASEQRVSLIIHMSDDLTKKASPSNNAGLENKDSASPKEVGFWEEYLPLTVTTVGDIGATIGGTTP